MCVEQMRGMKTVLIKQAERGSDSSQWDGKASTEEVTFE